MNIKHSSTRSLMRMLAAINDEIIVRLETLTDVEADLQEAEEKIENIEIGINDAISTLKDLV